MSPTKHQTKRNATDAEEKTSKKCNRDGNKKARIGDNKSEDEKKNCMIWLNNKLVVRPNYTTSYGILLYREADASNDNDKNDNDTDDNEGIPSGVQTTQFQYLLGLIPQGNSWTVFKGLPENNERPEETAMREFQEESSLDFPYKTQDNWESCPVKAELYGVTSTKKLLQIFLIPAPPELDISKFNVDNVVKIDGNGRFSGVPEIIEIKFLTKKQAIEGIRGQGKNKVAKIYKSQISILERADTILNNKSAAVHGDST